MFNSGVIMIVTSNCSAVYLGEPSYPMGSSKIIAAGQSSRLNTAVSWGVLIVIQSLKDIILKMPELRPIQIILKHPNSPNLS